ncbi:MAG: hypothetical protein K2X47_18995, partial [Bdellovibrionales bacterium]|nr:hypothetical protein [Bdellovibrionales bacterium]
ANLSLSGCQRDHFNFSSAINGIFWYDPALYPAIYKVLRSSIYSMTHAEAIFTMNKSFCEDSDGTQASAATHRQAIESYRAYLADFNHITAANKEMAIMRQNSVQKHLTRNRRALSQFERKVRADGKVPSRISGNRVFADGAPARAEIIGNPHG